MNKVNNTQRRSWLSVFTAGAFFCYSFIQMTLFSTEAMKQYFMSLLSLETASEFGNFAGTFLYGTVLLLIPIGLLLDRFSVKKVIIISLAIDILALLGLTFTTNVHIAMCIRFIMGIAHCVAFMAPFRLAPRWFPSKSLALISGLLVTFGVFGGWISGAPMLSAITAFGGETALLMNVTLGVFIFILSVLLIKDFPESREQKVESNKESLSVFAGLKIAASNKQNWLAGAFIGLLNLAVLLLGAVWGTTYLKFVNPDFTEATYTGIIGMIFIGTMIGSPLGGLISDKLQSRKKVMIGGGILSLIVMLLIMFPPSICASLFYVLFLLLGIITASQSVGYPVIGESNDDRVLGTANGLSSMILMGMGALGQPLFGQLVALFGGGDGASTLQLQDAFRCAIWLMPIAFVGAIICGIFTNETFKKL